MASTPAVQFYIKNYKDSSGNVITDETSFMTIPFTKDPVISEPKVKCEMGKAGSFEFTVEMTSPYYNAFMQMKTIMRVELFGRTIFRGRVLTIDKKLARSRAIHCEGDFAFLLDTIQAGTKEDSRPTISVHDYLTQLIDSHNAQLSASGVLQDSDKVFTLGEVPGQYTSTTASTQKVTIPSDKEKQQFGDTGYNTTMDRLENLLSDFGGYFRTRYDSNTNITYLDWYDRYYDATANTQTIEVAKNLIDISGPTEVENLFTVIIPIGKKDSENIYITDYWPVAKSGHAKVNYMTVPELATIPLYTDSELNADYHQKSDYVEAISRYGVIWKTVDFENANTPEKLFNYCKDWIKNNYMPELTQWDVSALDLRFVDGMAQALYCGDRVGLKHPEVDQTFGTYSVIAATYDLFNPDKNKYTVGIPNQQINAAYGVKEKTNKESTKSGGSKKASGGGGSPKPKDPPVDNTEKIKADLTYQYILKTKGNDIGLDDPLAYLGYNTDGTKKTAEQQKYAIVEDAYTLMKSGAFTTRKMDLVNEGIRQGKKWNDASVVATVIPEIKEKSEKFKIELEKTAIKAGLTAQQAQVLTRDSSSSSWLASLVDDDGNWTPEAIQQGATIWNPKMKEMAINTRSILNGVPQTDMLSAMDDALSGGGVTAAINSLSERIGSFFNVDGMNFQFDIGNLISEDGSNIFGDILNIMGSADGVGNTFNWLKGMFTGGNNGGSGNTFEFLTENMNISGEGGIGSGKESSTASGGGKWRVSIDQDLSYVDSSGNTVTLPKGTINAKDYAELKAADGKPIPSFSTKFAVIDNLIAQNIYAISLKADQADFNTLSSKVASIDRITSKAITTDNLSSKIASLSTISTSGGAQMSGSTVSCSTLDTTYLKVNGNTYSWKTARITMADGSTGSIQYLGA